MLADRDTGKHFLMQILKPLIPISRKAYLYNLCRDYILSQEQSYALIGKDTGEEKYLEKSINKLNRNIKKLRLELEKELNL